MSSGKVEASLGWIANYDGRHKACSIYSVKEGFPYSNRLEKGMVRSLGHEFERAERWISGLCMEAAALGRCSWSLSC